MAELTFVTGGARSGKSAFAERLAASAASEARPVVYLATLEPLDDEMRDRIARHRDRRPRGWRTVEAPRALADAYLATDGEAVILLDCLSLWVSNRLLQLGEDPAAGEVATLEVELDAELARIIEAAHARTADTIVVSNEVGSGLVPPSALGRAYRDVLGRANQQLAAAADRAWLLVAGRAIELPANQ